MPAKNIVIVGGGTVGTEIKNQAEKLGYLVQVVRDVQPDQTNIVPADATDVIVTAQSGELSLSSGTGNLDFVNTVLPLRVLDNCLKLGVSRVAFFSTGSVYDTGHSGAVETDPVDPDRLPDYAFSKYLMEQRVKRYAQAFDCIRLYRPFMMYGAGLPKQRLLARLPDMLKSSSPITLANGKGLVCNPIHVVDVAKFVLEQLDGTGCEILNLAGDEIVNLREISEEIGKAIGCSPVFHETSDPEAIVIGDNSKAKSAGLGYSVSVREGLKDLVKDSQSSSNRDGKRTIQIALPSMGYEEFSAVRDPIIGGWLTQGPKVAEFERQFSSLHQVAHSLATSSCTTALHLALAALGVGPGDEVIVPAFTWVATANVVLYCGATPVFVDIDEETFNINVEEALRKVNSKTKAVIPVHLFGLCADIDRLRDGLPNHVAIVEDAACAAGAQYNGRFAGSLGDLAAFSFHPRKSITTGEGGMLSTQDASLRERAEKLRNHGAEVSEEQRHAGPKPYLLPDFNHLGFNYRMTDIQGAVGVVQLRKLEKFINERAVKAKWYRDQLSSLAWLRCPEEPVNGRHAWQAFVTFVDPETAPMSRNEIMDRLQAEGISTRPGTHAVHMLNYYKERFGLRTEDFPIAAKCDRQTMALPLHNRMNSDDYAYVVSALKKLG